ncbi:penicillin-binding protein [bacterium]|nr:penicillin-binding protein [bacterium]
MAKKKKKRLWLKWAIRIGLGGLGIVVLLFALVYFGAFGHVPTESELESFEQYKASQVIAAQGELIGKIYVEDRTDLSLDELPQYVIDALIATEDARYYEHEGLDSRSLARVLIKTLILNQDAGGGSTITMQLAKNMYGRKDLGFLSAPVAKIRESIIARRLETVFDKDQILILYLNQVPFGENTYGIESAAQRFFNKKARDLRLEEAAVLVGMLKANTSYNPRLHPEESKARRNVVLAQMANYDYLDGPAKDSFQALPLNLDYANFSSKGPANYFLVHVKENAAKILEQLNSEGGSEHDLKKDGLVIKTTLDYTAQNAALKGMATHLSKMQKQLRNHYFKWNKKGLKAVIDAEIKRLGFEKREIEEHVQEVFDWDGFYSDTLTVQDSLALSLTLLHAGIFGLDPKSGAVKTWVGGVDFRTQPYDQIYAKRQMASSFKPILYAAALQSGVDPCTRLDNDSIVLIDGKPWSPENYDHSYGGTYSMAGALAKSMNIPTVNLYFEVGFKELVMTWKNLGFSSTLKDRPVTALGPVDASLYEAAVAYAAFANGGYKVEPYMIESISTREGQVIYEHKAKKKRRVLNEKTAAYMNYFLQKVMKEGTGRGMNSYWYSGDIAGKTGTSQNYADAWFIAYNSSMVLASRVGASTPQIHFSTGSGSGSALALPLVGHTLKILRQSAAGARWKGQFPAMNEDWQDELDCPDYLEDSMLRDWLDQIRTETEDSPEDDDRKKRRKEKLKRFLREVLGAEKKEE